MSMRMNSPVEPFGGKDDFDASRTRILYAALDPELSPAQWYTKQSVILKDSDFVSLTSGKHYATHSPVPTNDGTKVARAGLAEDGYESDLATPVAYDLKKARTEAHVKVFVLSVPASELGSDKKLTSPSSPYLVAVPGKIQGWILKPKGYSDDDEKEWTPLSLIHGGPQGAWEDRWSTRWNPNEILGEKAACRSPKGMAIYLRYLSSGEDPGPLSPFACPPHPHRSTVTVPPLLVPVTGDTPSSTSLQFLVIVTKGVPSWIQSNSGFEFGFKALVCHDGVFDSQYDGYSTDEPFF
ncbi:hypothetical protein BDM02DRAFT_3133044, partial [Thelephora ganbajun]